MVGLAVNVTEVPAHIVLLGETLKLTVGTKIGLTVIVLESETGAVEAQVAFEIISTFTTSLFAKLLRINVFPVTPITNTLFKYHLY